MATPKFHTLTVKEVNRETLDTVSVCFDVPEELHNEYAFEHGQYLTLRKTLNDEDTRRSYSVCSGVDEGELCVAIKQVEGGLFSTFANTELASGDELEVMTPMGHFTTPLDPSNSKHYVLIAAGSGITPIMSIVKSVLSREPNSEVSLLYGNRKFDNIIFRDELEDLKDEFLGRMRVFHVLSGELNEIDLFAGRIDGPKVKKFFSTFLSVDRCDEVFICGPQPMIESATDTLKDLGLDESKIHFELFTSPKGELYKERPVEVEEKFVGKNCDVDLTLYGQKWSFQMPFDKPVLDAAIEQGLDLPFSCKGGMCCTCRAKLDDGKVDMRVSYGLEPGEIDQGYILTCQSIPKSEKIVVDFDK